MLPPNLRTFFAPFAKVVAFTEHLGKRLFLHFTGANAMMQVTLGDNMGNGDSDCTKMCIYRRLCFMMVPIFQYMKLVGFLRHSQIYYVLNYTHAEKLTKAFARLSRLTGDQTPFHKSELTKFSTIITEH